MTKPRTLANSVNPGGLDGALLGDNSVAGSKLAESVYGVAYVENFDTGAGTNAALQAAIDSSFSVISAKGTISVNDAIQLLLASGKTFINMTIESTAVSVNNGNCFLGNNVQDISFINCTFILKNRHRAARFIGSCSNLSFEGCKFISESPAGLLGYSAYALQIGDETNPIKNVKVTNCFFDNCCGSAAVALREVEGAVVSSSVFKASISAAFNYPFYPTQVDLANGSDAVISGNTIDIPANATGANYFGYGIYQGDGSWDRLTISDNVIKKTNLNVDGQSIGIKVGGGTNSLNTVISGNTISGVGLHSGVFLLNVDKTVVSSNLIDDVIVSGIDLQQSLETTIVGNDIKTASSGDAHGIRVGENFDYSLSAGLCVIDGNKIKKRNVGSGRGCIGFWRYHPRLVIKSNTLDAVDSVWVRSIFYGEKVFPGTSSDPKYGILSFSKEENALLVESVIGYQNALYDVKDFGAVGDNFTSDTGAFQRAVDFVSGQEGATLLIPAGTYRLQANVLLNSNIRIIGAGKGCTVIRPDLRTATDGATVSGCAFYSESKSNITIEGITFDGNKVVSSGNGTGPATARSLLEFISCTNVTIRDCDFTRYLFSLPTGYVYSDSTYRIGAIFAYDSERILLENLEYVSPTYGNLTMLTQCRHVDFNLIKSTFANVASGSVNESPINCWGDTCRFVTVRNCVFENTAGSAINLGGSGDFIVKENFISNGKGIDLTNENWTDPGSHPDVENVLITGNVLNNPTSSITGSQGIEVGNIPSVSDPKFHNVIVSNNTIITGSSSLTGALLVGGSENAIISGNTLTGSSIQINYCSDALIQGNTIDGKSVVGADNYGINIYTRPSAAQSYIQFKNNTVSRWGGGAVNFYGFAGGPNTNGVISDNDFVFPTAPSGGKYVRVVPSGGNPAYKIGKLTIDRNRLNGDDYVPFQGSDNDMLATSYNFGSVTPAVGIITRDMTTASGTQTVTGLGFSPKSIVLLSAQDTSTDKFSIGVHGRVATSGGSTKAGLYRYAADNGYGLTSNHSVLAYESASDYYEGTVTSLDADGFTITWTKNGSPSGTLNIAYLAFK